MTISKKKNTLLGIWKKKRCAKYEEWFNLQEFTWWDYSLVFSLLASIFPFLWCYNWSEILQWDWPDTTQFLYLFQYRVASRKVTDFQLFLFGKIGNCRLAIMKILLLNSDLILRFKVRLRSDSTQLQPSFNPASTQLHLVFPTTLIIWAC